MPVLGTREWLAKLQLTETAPSRPWSLNGQVAGWTTQYKELTFATVRNAGHMVPETQGARGLALVNAFLSGTPL